MSRELAAKRLVQAWEILALNRQTPPGELLAEIAALASRAIEAMAMAHGYHCPGCSPDEGEWCPRDQDAGWCAVIDWLDCWMDEHPAPRRGEG